MLVVMISVMGILLFFVGASVFSFLNVVIYRVPKKSSFVGGRSYCPSCGKTLKGIHMIPVLNWFFLRGKCFYCKSRISVRYPMVEALGGLLACLSAYYFGLNIQALLVFLFLGVLTVITFIDKDTMEIPNGCVIAVGMIGLVSAFFFPEIGWISRGIGIFVVSVPLLLIALAVPGGFGGGDIKLMAVAGLFLGWQLTLLSLFLAVLGGGAYGAWLMLAKHVEKKAQFAFGPFLCVGMGIAVFVGKDIIQWYVGFLVW